MPLTTPLGFVRNLPVFALIVLAFVSTRSLNAQTVTWGNFTGTTNFTDGAAWLGSVAPATSGTARFHVAAVASPNLAVTSTISSLQFSAAAASGYVFSNSNSATLNLSSLGNSITTAAIASLNTSGSNLIGTNINLLALSGSTQVFTQAAGAVLVFNGTISSNNSIRLQLQNSGSYAFNAANTFSGTLNQSAGSVLVVGNKNALGTSVYNPSGVGAKIVANTTLTGSNKITNNTLLGTTLGIDDGGFALELSGNIDMGGAARSIASGGLSFATGPIIAGVISNDGGLGLTYSRNAVNSFTTVSGTSSTYTGLTTIDGLNLAVAKIGMTGSASSLGTSGTIQIGVGSRSSTLTYNGSGETTDKTVSVQGSTGSSIDTTGATGALIFSSSVALTSASAKTFTLRGDTTGNEIQGNITQPSGTLTVTKDGTGSWKFGGSNSYTGVTTINAGALILSSANALPGGIGSSGGTSALTIGGGVVGIASGTFSRGLGTGVTQVRMEAGGGFAAYGADRSVNLGGASAVITWGVGNFVNNGNTFILGAADADATIDFQNPLALVGTQRTIQVDNGSAAIDAKFSGTLTSTTTVGGFNKTGAGTLQLSAVNSYTGTTAVNAGTLLVSGTGTINSSARVAVAGGARFVYSNTATSLNPTVTLNGSGTSSRAVLGGKGTINSAVTLDNLGDTLSPGESPGLLGFGVNQTWNSYSYDWELNNFLDNTSAGTAFDQINITGSLDLTGGTTGSMLLNVISLTAGNIAGNVPNFSETTTSWTILTATTGITGFSVSDWLINTAAFTSSPTATGSWSISLNDTLGTDSLVLTYTIVPEPSTVLLVGAGLILVLFRVRRSSRIS